MIAANDREPKFAMLPIHRKLTADNIDTITKDYCASLSSLGESIKGKTGIELLRAMKRDPVATGPYRGVALFEAANRIMSDLVIVYGIAGLLRERVFPFTTYTVELGNEDNNGFDIRAASDKSSLIGEAFNVAHSFYQNKKASAIRKLRPGSADFRMLMFNADAVKPGYKPRPKDDLYYVIVDIVTATIRVESKVPGT